MIRYYPYRYCPFCGSPLKRKKVEGKFRLFCPSCGRVIYENPVPVVAVVVRNGERVLLIRRGIPPQRGKWALPSGYMDLGEEPEKTALRELEEETGIRGRVKSLLGVFSQKSPVYRQVVVIGYEVEPLDLKIRPGDDADEVAFYDADRLPDIPFSSHREIIRKAFEGPE